MGARNRDKKRICGGDEGKMKDRTETEPKSTCGQ